jgi:prepilin-type N-terminal cleavage/methylation domain-containing protein
MIKKITQKNKKQTAGFSVIELIVVISIFAIMSGVTLFNYGDYRQKIEEINVAQDVALSIRQAQIYGISASNKDVGQTFSDTISEAEFFENKIADITDNTSVRGISIEPNTNTLNLFEDVNKDRVYTLDTDVLIDQRRIITGSVFMKACLNYSTPTNFETCEVIEEGSSPIDITFQRPYPDTYTLHNEIVYTHVWLGFFEDLSQVEPNSYIAIEPSGQISVIKN